MCRSEECFVYISFVATPPRLPRFISHGIDQNRDFLLIECEDLAAAAASVAAAVGVLGCWKVRKDLQLTLGVFLE